MKTRLQKPLYFLTGILFLLFLFLLLLPTFLSMPFGKKELEHRISRYTGGTLTLASLSCSWWGEQKIEGLELRDAQNRLIFQAPRIEIDAPLWKILILSDVGQCTLTTPEYLLLEHSPFLSHIPVHWQACQLIPPLASKVGINLTRLSGTIEVLDGKVAVAVPEIDPVLFSHIHLTALFPKNKKQIEVTLQCDTLQQQIAGSMNLKASIENLEAARPSIQAEATLVKLPVQGIDQLISRFSQASKGLLLDLIGPMMDLSVQLQTSKEVFELNLTALSPQFSAQIATQNANDWISLKNPGLIRLTLPPSSFAKFSQIFPALRGILLKQPTTFLLNVAELSMPLQPQEAGAKTIKIDATLSSEANSLWMFKETPLVLGSLECRFLTPNVEDPLYVSGQATFIFDDQSCNLVTEMKCRHLFHSSRECSGLLQIETMPTLFATQCMDWPSSWTEYVGPAFNSSFQFALSPTGQQFEWSLDAPYLSIPSLAFSTNGGAHLLKPATLTYKGSQDSPIQCTLSELEASFAPLKVLSAIEVPLAKNAPLNALLGPQLNCKFKIEPESIKNPSKESYLGYFEATSSQFQGNGICLVDPQSIQSKKCQIRWTLLPEAYPLLDKLLTGQGKAPFVLQSPTTFDIRLEEIYIPLASLSREGSLLNKATTQWRFAAHGRNELFAFSDVSGKESIQLSHSSFDCDPSHLTLHTEIQTTDPSQNAVQGLFECSLTKESSTPFQGTFDLKAKQFPTRVLDMIARVQGQTEFPFANLFGKTLDAEASLSLQKEESPIALSIRSPQTQMTLAGSCQGGLLRLNQPFFFQTYLTSELSRLFLKNINPLSITSIYAKSPISLEIPPQGVSIPIMPFTPSHLNIPEAHVEIGKIYCQNEGNVHIALDLLKSQQKHPGEELMLWFAPIDFHATKGVIDVERTEILIANALDIAIWGNMNLKKNYVDMTLGLPAPTLQKAFDIRGLPQDYVLTIPMKGPLNDVQIDTGKATAKLALLFAWQKRSLAGNITKNPAGAIFGEVIGQLALLPDKDAVIPPAKHPFPWESSSGPTKKGTSSSSKKRHFTLKEKPLKQLLKVIR